VLGTIRHVHAFYHQSWLVHDYWGDWRTKPAWLWRLSKKHGSHGALNDIGIHILDFASMPLGSIDSVHCRLKCFEKKEGASIGEYSFDANDSAIITAEFTNGALGTIHTTRWAYPHQNDLRLDLYGDEASVEIDLNASTDRLKINRILGRQAMEWETLHCGTTPNIWQRFIRAIQSGQPEQPDFARGAEIQAVLDACHESAERDQTIHIEHQQTDL
jgi:Predicted dehydrogenases and related proteins